MNRKTGRACDDELEHIGQAIEDILGTPIGSRVKRRPYGSLIPQLIDQPANPANRLRLMSASIMAIITWEPRVRVQGVNVSYAMNGEVFLDLDAIRAAGQRAGTAFNMTIPL